MESKKWWESKTIRVALIQFAGGLLTAYLTQNPTWAYGAGAKSALDVALRFVSTTEIKTP